jgi:hypothetical protein
MKSIFLKISFFFLLSPFYSTAQELITVGVSGGFSLFPSTVNAVGTNPGIGFCLRYFSSPHFSMGFSFRKTFAQFKGSDYKVAGRFSPLTLSLEYYPLKGNFSPYIGTDVGLQFSALDLTYNLKKESYDIPSYFFSPKLGVKYQFDKRWMIAGEVIPNFIKFPNNDPLFLDTDLMYKTNFKYPTKFTNIQATILFVIE